MSKLAALGLGALIVPIVVALSALVLMLLGAAAGWLAGIVFPQVFENLSDMLFGKAVPAWQIGAMFGFIGAFFGAAGKRGHGR